MATTNFTFTTLTGTETAGWNSINSLITSIDTQLNTSNRLIYMSGWSAVAGQTIKWDAANSRWAPGTLDAAALANNSVTEAKIATDAVTSGKIAADAVGSSEIAAGAVTLAKISPTGSSAGQVLTSTGSGSDPSWQNASIGEANIANNAVTDAKLRDSSGLSVIGRAANTTGDPADITANTNGDILRLNGTNLGFGKISANSLDTDASARLAQGHVTVADNAAKTALGNVAEGYMVYQLDNNKLYINKNGVAADWVEINNLDNVGAASTSAQDGYKRLAHVTYTSGSNYTFTQLISPTPESSIPNLFSSNLTFTAVSGQPYRFTFHANYVAGTASSGGVFATLIRLWDTVNSVPVSSLLLNDHHIFTLYPTTSGTVSYNIKGWYTPLIGTVTQAPVFTKGASIPDYSAAPDSPRPEMWVDGKVIT